MLQEKHIKLTEEFALLANERLDSVVEGSLEGGLEGWLKGGLEGGLEG